MLFYPVAEFLLVAFAIDKIDISGAFIAENGGELGVATLAIRFAHEQLERLPKSCAMPAVLPMLTGSMLASGVSRLHPLHAGI